MSKGTTLLRRVKAAQRKFKPPAKTWLFLVEEGETLSQEDTANVRDGDTILIRGMKPTHDLVGLPTRRSCRATPPPMKKSRIGEDAPTLEIARILCLGTRPRD